MANFWDSNLVNILGGNDMLSQDAWDFVCACMDDFCVDEDSVTDSETMYELRGTLTGYYKGKPVNITEVYYGGLCEMAAVIEYLARMNWLMLEDDIRKANEYS